MGVVVFVSDPDGPLGYDLSVAKRMDALWSRDAQTRVGLSAVVLITLWQVFDLWQTLVILLAYSAVSFLHGYVVARMPLNVGRGGARLIQASSMLVGLTWMGGLVFLWMQDGMEIRLVALTGLYLSMLNAMTVRQEDALLSVADTVHIAISILALGFVSYYVRGATGEAISFLISSSMAFAYYCSGLFEMRKMRAEVARSQKIEIERSRMETVGRLTGGVAHDFNNLLTVIHGNLELIKEHDTPEQKNELARQALYATARASRVTAQLLTFVGRGSIEPTALDIYRVFDRVGEHVDRLLPSSIGLARTIEPDFPILHLDVEKLETVLISLCINARNALPEGGDIRLTARRTDLVVSYPDLAKAGRFVCIEVADNGVGIAPELLDRVCEPYVTTRSHGGGLSLASAKGFAMQSGGDLKLESKLGQGTVVSLLLPVSDPAS